MLDGLVGLTRNFLAVCLPRPTDESPLNAAEQACLALETAAASGHAPDIVAALDICDQLVLAARPAALPEPVPRGHHAVLHRVGTALLEAGDLENAERYAIASLKALPRFGAAFKLLGRILSEAGQADDAALCHRYGLPFELRQRWFELDAVEAIDSRRDSGAGLERKLAWPSETVALKQPQQVSSRVIPELSASELVSLEASTTCVPQGRLWFDTFNIVVWDREGRLVSDLCRGYSEVVQSSLGSRKAIQVEGRVALLGNRNQSNYYHWMNDVLPRLSVLEASGYVLNEIDRFVLAPLVADFQIESLERFGITAERLLFTPQAELIQADEVLVPIFGSNALGLRQGAWAPEFLKRSFLEDSGIGNAGRRLYLSRGDSGARGIANEPALQSLLAEHGFEKVRSESMSLAEQAILFSEAEAVLGPHGAGFSNTVFCAPGTQVIELYDAHIAPCFWVISELMNLHHSVQYCGEATDAQEVLDNESYHRSADDRRRSPFSVDLVQLDQLLNLCGLEPRQTP